jgi:transposase InsO family protein
MTKTKQMLREKYWFPTMNTMVEQIIGDCFECKVTMKQYNQEPVKPTVIPEKPWDVIAVDFGGPYPDCHYNLVAIDKRTRYSEVGRTMSTSFHQMKEKLKTIFANHGIPRQIESDNRPSFQSKDFEELAEEEGFHHHCVTLRHARANGEAESFMKLLNKTERIAHFQGQNSTITIQGMLTGFRSTPDPATGFTPYEAMMNRPVRTKLDHRERNEQLRKPGNATVNRKDKEYKEKMRDNAQNRNTKEHNLTIGDHVLLKQSKKNKWSTAYEPWFYIITRVDGSSIVARRIQDG